MQYLILKQLFKCYIGNFFSPMHIACDTNKDTRQRHRTIPSVGDGVRQPRFQSPSFIFATVSHPGSGRHHGDLTAVPRPLNGPDWTKIRRETVLGYIVLLLRLLRGK